MKITTPAFLVAAGAGLLLLFTACYTVPVTGRSSFSMLSDSELAQMSAEQFAQMKQEFPISSDPKYTAMVDRVGRRIAEAAEDDIPYSDWEFVVFDDAGSINAFAMAGGKVGVFTGIFRVAANDDELAVVMGHEIAHVAARHVNERASQQMGMQVGGVLIGAVLGSGTGGQIAQQAYGLGSGLAGLSFSRGMEQEADHIGLIYAARAGYDPRAAVPFWEKMEVESSGQAAPPEFLSTHPSGDSRMTFLQEIMPEAVAEYEIATTP